MCEKFSCYCDHMRGSDECFDLLVTKISTDLDIYLRTEGKVNI